MSTEAAGLDYELLAWSWQMAHSQDERAGELEDRLVDALVPGGVLLIGDVLPASATPHRDAIVRRLGATQLAPRRAFASQLPTQTG